MLPQKDLLTTAQLIGATPHGRSLNFQNLSQTEGKKKKSSTEAGVPGVHIGILDSSTSLKDKVKFSMRIVEENDNTAEL